MRNDIFPNSNNHYSDSSNRKRRSIRKAGKKDESSALSEIKNSVATVI